MREYSAANVMQDYIEQPVGTFGRLFNSISRNLPVTLKIHLPHRIFLKGELMAEKISEEIDDNFNQNELIELLIEEFLAHYNLHGNPLRVHRLLKEINSSYFVTRYYEDREDKLKLVKVKLPRKLVFELEMVLADIEESNPNDFTVEKLIELQYMNVMQDMLTGNKEDVVQNIINMLQDDEDE